MRNKALIPAAVAAAFIAVPAWAGDAWQPIAIQAFQNEAGASTWLPNCAGKDGGHFDPPKDVAKITDAALDEDVSCVRFSYEGKIYFVREPAVQHSGAKGSTLKACDKEIASAQRTGSIGRPLGETEAVTMGAGEKVKCHK